jgi:hypothetical protein
MFELAWWFYYVGAEPVLSLASYHSRARQLVHKWNQTTLRRPTRSRTPRRGDFPSYHPQCHP